MRSIRASLFAIVLLSASNAGAAVFTVGGAGCTHANLPAAVAAAMANGPATDEIRLVNGQVPAMTAPLVVGDQSLTVRGGFGSCTATTPGAGSTTLSFPSSDGFRFDVGGTPRDLAIEGVRVIMPVATGRTLRASGWASVTLRNTFFSRGSASQGGNVHISGPNAQITLDRGTRLYQGQATQGGGIYCTAGAFIAVLGDVSIDGNTATGDGGGVYLGDGCGIGGGSLYGTVAIRENRADTGHGGGIFATNGARITLFGSEPEAIDISDNDAPAGRGGGIDASGTGTYVGIDNAWIGGNLSRFGAGLHLGAGAEGLLRTQSCVQRLSRPCLLIAGNVAAGGSGVTNTGGALRVTGGATLTVRRALIRNNNAEDSGSVLFATDAGTDVLLENTIITGNTGSLNQQFVTLDNGARATLAHVTAHAQQIGCCKHFFGRGANTILRVYSSVIHEERVFAPAGAGSSTALDCSIFPGLGDVPPGDFVVGVADAARLFRKRNATDLMPRPRAPLIDYCDTAMYDSPSVDFNGWPRPHDVPNVDNGIPGATYDLGAIEASWIFADDFQPD